MQWSLFLNEHYNRLDMAQKKGLQPGEVEVPDNGNCLFDSVCYLLQANGSDHMDVFTVRQNTVKWIKENYFLDMQLKQFLTSTMLDHYEAKVTNLENERESLSKPPFERQDMEKAQQQITSINTEINLYQPRINHLKRGLFNEETVDYLNQYLEEMSTSGTFGGHAELYALSRQYRVRFQIHFRQNGGTTMIEPTYERDKQNYPVRHLLYSGNHYNPYFPPSS